MPRIDGYPAADPLTGSEVLPGMQGGATKSISLDQLTDHMQVLLAPIIAQAVADAIAAGGGITPPDTTSTLTDSAGNTLVDSSGLFLVAA